MSDISLLPASSTFESFLADGLDRSAFISAWLRAREIPHTIVTLAGKQHIVIRFSSESYDPRFRMKTLVAHYDRAPGTPGANDNSAACFQLMLLSERLVAQKRVHNIRIFFTDGEEAASTKGIAGQGAFSLGAGFRKLKMTDDDVYVFDLCGRGDTLILSTAGIHRSGDIGKRLSALHKRATEIAITVSPENWLNSYTAYSDNAGFLAAGIAAQVFTVLPHEEATILLRGLSDSKTEKALTRAITANRTLPINSPLVEIVPETWQTMHTPKDTAGTLTASAFRLMERLLDEIAKRLDPAIA